MLQIDDADTAFLVFRVDRDWASMKPELHVGYMSQVQLDGERPFAREWCRPVNERRLGAQPGNSKVRFPLGRHADHGGARHEQMLRHAISVSSGFHQTECVAWPRGGLAGTKM